MVTIMQTIFLQIKRRNCKIPFVYIMYLRRYAVETVTTLATVTVVDSTNANAEQSDYIPSSLRPYIISCSRLTRDDSS
jgi:hypothetical protein